MRELQQELQAIAGDELAHELATWPARTPRLVAYLRAELADGGMLSSEQLADAGPVGRKIRRQAHAIVRAS